MKMKKVVAAMLLIVAMFAVNVVPVSACVINFTEQRQVVRTDTRANTNTTAISSWTATP